MITAARRGVRIAAKAVAETETVITCREIGIGTIRGADVGEEGMVVVEDRGEAADMIEVKRGGKTGTTTAIKLCLDKLLGEEHSSFFSVTVI
jgi:hypothetical protein